MAWNDSSTPNTQGFNWPLFASGFALGFFAGWIKRAVFALVGKKK